MSRISWGCSWQFFLVSKGNLIGVNLSAFFQSGFFPLGWLVGLTLVGIYIRIDWSLVIVVFGRRVRFWNTVLLYLSVLSSLRALILAGSRLALPIRIQNWVRNKKNAPTSTRHTVLLTVYYSVEEFFLLRHHRTNSSFSALILFFTVVLSLLTRESPSFSFLLSFLNSSRLFSI